MELYANHLTDNERAAIGLSLTNNNLMRFALDFCHAFSLRVSRCSNSAVLLETPNGLAVGKICMTRDIRKYDTVSLYAFESEAIVLRERSTGKVRGGNGRYTRACNTVKALIAAVKKNDAPITEQNLAKYHTQGLISAVLHTMPASYEFATTMRVPAVMIKPLVYAALGIDTYSVQQHRQELEQFADKYRQENAAVLANEKTAKRFAHGCTAVGIDKSWGSSRMLFAKARVSISPESVASDELELVTPLVNTYELPPEVMGKAAMVKAYLASKNETGENVFGIRIPYRNDEYLEDVDVIVYTASRTAWVVIPDLHEDEYDELRA